MEEHQPKGSTTIIATIVAVIIALGLIVVALMYGAKPQVVTPANVNGNANDTVVNVSCKKDTDCATYCGLSSDYQAVCATASDANPGYCTCRGIGAITPQNLNSSSNVSITNTNTRTNANSNANVNTSTNVNTNSNVSTAGWKTYTNTELGFTLKFPSTWDGYTVSQVTSNHSIKFTHPKTVSSKGNPGEVSFIITRLQKGTDIPTGTSFVDENATYTFVYTPSNAAAPDELNALWEQIPQIITTFTFYDYSLNLPVHS